MHGVNHINVLPLQAFKPRTAQSVASSYKSTSTLAKLRVEDTTLFNPPKTDY